MFDRRLARVLSGSVVLAFVFAGCVIDSDLVDDLKGDDGEAGAAADDGEAGAAADDGEAGAAADDGAAGAAGDDGAAGAAADDGTGGAAGDVGTGGVAGDDGTGGAVTATGGNVATGGIAEGGAPGAGAPGSAGSATTPPQGGAAGAETEGPVIDDPAPDLVDPGETRRCSDGGPDSDVTVFDLGEVADSSHLFGGTVTGATADGRYYATDGTQAIEGVVPTELDSGAFSLTLPLFCGAQTIKFVWSDGSCETVVVYQITRGGCESEDIRLTLSWDELGDDYELHLIKEGGRINDNATDCTWTSCLSGAQDWGVVGDASDNPRKDVDDTDTFGPENIYLSRPAPGTYTVMVEHWGPGLPESDGTLIFNVAGATHVAEIQDLASRWVWTVGTIEWPSGIVTLSQDRYDCTGNWSGGCRAEIP